MERIGFGAARKVIIYNNIDGTKIKDFDEDFYSDTLGISGPVELQKLRFNIG